MITLKESSQSCNLYTVRKIVERLTSGGNTVNLCALLICRKPSTRLIIMVFWLNWWSWNVIYHVCFLEIIEHWLNICHSVVKWNSILSYKFVVNFGVRQGSVLSPFLFAVFLNDIWVNQQISPNYYVIIYADDILLISLSICELQHIFDIVKCERELMWLDMVINLKKSCCMHAHWPKKRLYRK